MIPVILAGGKGERFWPLSRQHRPKQLLSLDGSGESLLQATAQRLLPLGKDWDHLFVVTGAIIAGAVQAQLPDLPEANLLVEPQGRDTAPAVIWAALVAAKRFGPEAVLGFFPADHWIGDTTAFGATLEAAADLALREDAIVTLGITPDHPATGYGYIEQGLGTGNIGGHPTFKVQRFTEKPDRATAVEFLASGHFSWNSGIFVFRAEVALQELRQYVPEMVQSIESLGAAAYDNLPKISLDYALMEKTQRAYVLPANFGWDDLGDWNAIARLHQPTGHAGANVELAHHVGLDTHNSLIYASDPQEVVVTLGLDDTIIVRDGNVTLIAKKERSQEIKQLLKQLQGDANFQGLL